MPFFYNRTAAFLLLWPALIITVMLASCTFSNRPELAPSPDISVLYTKTLSQHHHLIAVAKNSASSSDCMRTMRQTLSRSRCASYSDGCEIELSESLISAAEIYCKDFRTGAVFHGHSARLTDALVTNCGTNDDSELNYECNILSALHSDYDLYSPSNFDDDERVASTLRDLIQSIEQTPPYAWLINQRVLAFRTRPKIFVVPYAGEFDAYATKHNAFIASTSDKVRGETAVEFAVHELLHLGLTDAIKAQVRLFGNNGTCKSTPDHVIAHALIFVIAGIVTRDSFSRIGIDYTPYVEKSRILNRLFDRKAPFHDDLPSQTLEINWDNAFHQEIPKLLSALCT
jgi:hypothetical protein